MKKLHIIISCLVAVVLIVFYIKNMITPVFFIGIDVYKKKSLVGNVATYYSKTSGKSVGITDRDGFKEIDIDNKVFKVYGELSKSANRYESELMTIEYPDGKVVKGTYDSNLGLFFYINKEGKLEPEFPTPVAVISTGQKLSNEKTSTIKNGTIVTIAFEPLQKTNGDPAKYIPGIFILAIGLINLKIPKSLFYLRHGLWVENPEPSELYSVIAKVGGIASCILGLILIVFSVEVF